MKGGACGRKNNIAIKKKKSRPRCANTRDGKQKKLYQANYQVKTEECQVAKTIDLNFKYVKDTKTCYVFENGVKPEFTTLYLKKSQIDNAGIDPKSGITVTITQ